VCGDRFTVTILGMNRRRLPIILDDGEETGYEWIQSLSFGEDIVTKEPVSHIPKVRKIMRGQRY
jgi:hypothetical protein